VACFSIAAGVLAGIRGPEGIFLKKLDAARQERSTRS
jgi:hypothetical protein